MRKLVVLCFSFMFMLSLCVMAEAKAFVSAEMNGVSDWASESEGLFVMKGQFLFGSIQNDKKSSEKLKYMLYREGQETPVQEGYVDIGKTKYLYFPVQGAALYSIAITYDDRVEVLYTVPPVKGRAELTAGW